MVIVLIGISFITFALIYMAPGDPVRAMYSSSGVIPSEEVMNQTREAMGLNKLHVFTEISEHHIHQVNLL